MSDYSHFLGKVGVKTTDSQLERIQVIGSGGTALYFIREGQPYESWSTMFGWHFTPDADQPKPHVEGFPVFKYSDQYKAQATA